MNREEMLLDIKIQLESLITEREGMAAENQYRKLTANSFAYCEDSFAVLKSKIESLINEVRSICQKF